MAQEPVFRFLALRQPRKKQPKNITHGSKLVNFAVTAKLPPLAQHTASLPQGQRTLANMTDCMPLDCFLR